MGLTRFERKILFAIGAVAVVPLVAALVLGRAALGEAYQVGVNRRVHGELERALEVYRDHFVALRDDAERTADAVAGHWKLRDAVSSKEASRVGAYLDHVLREYPNVAAVSISLPGGEVLAEAKRPDRLDEARMRLLTQRRDLASEPPGARAEVIVATPAEPFHAYQRAGEVEEVYSRLRASGEYVSNYYLVVYIAFLLSVIVIAIGVGFVLSRRVTRRVADLAVATQRVGAGDLTVEVPTDARDEVGELTRAFNDMVRDLRESRVRIEYLQRIGAWQEFARRLAHEIKNPLTPIQLAAQEMLTSYGGDDERFRSKLQDACAIIQEEVATLRRLVGEFSAFAKLPQVKLAEADLRDFVLDLERQIPGIVDDVGASGITVVCEPGDEPLPVRIDAMMLKRGVDNLVRNALQALRERPSGRVVVAARRVGDEALLEVRDDGPGVPAEDRARVFDPYYTTRSEGTGLGLAIVKKVVLEHSGEVECGGAPEGGAALRIRLPLLVPREARRGGRGRRSRPSSP